MDYIIQGPNNQMIGRADTAQAAGELADKLHNDFLLMGMPRAPVLEIYYGPSGRLCETIPAGSQWIGARKYD